MVERWWFPLLLGLVVFAGCGQQSKPPLTVKSPDSIEVVRKNSDKVLSKSERGPRQVAVAAAADLKYALDDLIGRFQAQSPGIVVEATYGSSGNFYAQLTNKAPFDLYLSADIHYPRKLAEQKLTLEGSEFQYAVGEIVVWVRKESPLDLKRLGIQALRDPSVRKIAIANPQHAPYGRAAEAALKKLGLYEQVQERLVFGENIAQAAQFVESGASEAGIIARSLAMAPPLMQKGDFWEIPLDAYPPLEQGGVVLAWVKDREATEIFREYLVSEPGRTILRQYGFRLPGE